MREVKVCFPSIAVPTRAAFQKRTTLKQQIAAASTVAAVQAIT